ncbi:RimJ/RimL family protein N-acetyltransferase [Novosphingobium chloroacetimidivorans]|uniref:RimJ/RimL family protein N-acetyltransferase n=1 Tax=Novosphingobium chloroacetimidivorans TaxID=1428314 RepID=A0A7W7K8P3_9SPHN|nr:GNAT family N-acetyltransferase [Novosphingobium chloroacetimidivorans]MBB4857739.1 RimJ/RimL family protein N-acetyltransferase [Novosphingobium chloroacetimidivorans]
MSTPYLTTERFELWCPRGPQDVEPLCRLIADDETRRFLGPARAEPQSQWERLMRNAGSWSLYGYGVFYVRPHGSDELIGSMGVFHSWRGLDPRMDDQPEAGWIVRSDWAGRGVAGEVMQAALAWFDAEHGVRRIVAMIEHENAASHRVAAKLGFSTYASIPDKEGRTIDLYERVIA